MTSKTQGVSSDVNTLPFKKKNQPHLSGHTGGQEKSLEMGTLRRLFENDDQFALLYSPQKSDITYANSRGMLLLEDGHEDHSRFECFSARLSVPPRKLRQAMHDAALYGLAWLHHVAMFDHPGEHTLTIMRSFVEDEESFLFLLAPESPPTIEQAPRMIGFSAPMHKVLEDIAAVAQTDSPVLIRGETGTGKDLAAQMIHTQSERALKPYIKLDCSALPPELFDDELFGHQKGAFNSAGEDRPGLLEKASSGTLFLEQVHALSLAQQAKLLSVIHRGESARQGETKTRRIDVRLIAASDKDLWTLVQQQGFRIELYHYLYAFPLSLPALKERKEDIPLLVMHFIKKYQQKHFLPQQKSQDIKTAELRLLIQYPWPGNVRELEHLVERAVIKAQQTGEFVLLDQKKPWTPASETFVPGTEKNEQLVFSGLEERDSLGADDSTILTFQDIKELEKKSIFRALEQSRGRIYGQKGAANLLKIKPTTLLARLKKLGIQAKQSLQ